MNNIDEKDDRYWTVEEIRPYIIGYLKKQFPDSIIEREFDNVDIMVLGPNITVEIQRVYKRASKGLGISYFEDSIRRQIEQNIDMYGLCWFFFDAKFLDHLQNNLPRNVSINMDWLYQFFKSGKLMIFTITINGVIRELEGNDFEFIKKYSSTCKLSKNEEDRILGRNKSKMAYNIYRGHGLTTEDINSWYDEYKKNTDDLTFKNWLMKNGGRRKELGIIKGALCSIYDINEMLKCNLRNDKTVSFVSILGIIEGNGNKYSKAIRCSDEYDVLKYFPGYFIKQELWDYWKTHVISSYVFHKVIKGEYHNYLKDRKNQKDIEDAWN